MDVAIYHPWLKEKGGAEKVVLEYARNSENDVTVYTLFYDKEKCFTDFEDVKVKELYGGEPRGFVMKGLVFGLGSIIYRIPEKHDKLVISEAGLGSLMAFRNSHETYCYCHTPLRIFLPEFEETYKQELSPLLRPFFGAMKTVYGFLEKRAWDRFEKVFANSETTKERILSKGLKHSDDVEVINPGVDIDVEQGDMEDYFLYPSRFRRYKRQDLAIEAFEKADLEDFELDLLLMGSAQEKDFLEELREKAGGNVEIKTDVPDGEWREMYRDSYSVLFLAEKEDWGMVPLEAGAYSKPVIAVNEGGPTESVLHDETGLLVEDDPDEIAEAMEELAEHREKAEEMGEEGRKRAREYSWGRFAEKIDSGLEDDL